MEFWKMAYEFGWVDAQQLRGAVKTETRIRGEISKEQYKQITGLEFEVITNPVTPPVQFQPAPVEIPQINPTSAI